MACTEDSKELSICHINARSILAYNAESGSNQFKMDEIRHILSDQLKYNLITVSETSHRLPSYSKRGYVLPTRV